MGDPIMAAAACVAVIAVLLYHTRFQPPNADFIGYNLGFPKTGTVALADMFAKANLTAAHEFDRDALLLPVLQKLANDDSGPIRAYMTGERRDRMLARFGRPALHMDSSSLNLFFVEELLELHPSARFVMTVRSPFAQYNSLLNHVNTGWMAGQMAEGQPVRVFLELVFGAPSAAEFPEEERAFYERFAARGGKFVWPFRDIVQSNTYFVHHALSAVPAGRLLLVRTDRLSEVAERAAIEDFFGLARGVLPATAKKFATEKFDFADALPPAYVARLTRAHCAKLAELFERHGRGDVCDGWG